MADSSDSIGIVLFVLASIATLLNIVSVFLKICRDFSTPKLWKYSLLYQDVSFVCLCVGLTLFSVHSYVGTKELCSATGFFLLFGFFLSLTSFLTTGIILLSIQNPGKPSSLSKFHRNIVILIILPEVVLSAVVSFLPYVSEDLFDTDVTFDVTCFPVRDHDVQGAAFGTLLVVLWWLILIAVGVFDVIIILKLYKFNNRINSAQNNVWQSQILCQGKTVIKLALVDHIVCIVTVLGITVAIYSDITDTKNDSTWIVLTSLAISASIHGILSIASDVMFITCCCRDGDEVKEPHRKLKKLELLKIEAPGKLRMKATWTIGKHATKRGLMKVYGVDHLKSWANEIVMLGMLRRTQHPALIQCLWTNSSNPYYETMTLISGDIITSDSRIICLELTNGGTLQDFLQKCELPLPEPCQRMIIHDVAEGLFYLHHESILHNNLSTSCIYLKGSLQNLCFKKGKSMVLRAAIGDFEDAQLYGTLQLSMDSSLRDKKYFFLPDIRSFALIALEIVGKMCEKRFQNRYVNYSADHVPMKLNLETVLSDEEDEFGAQYRYYVEDTARNYEPIHPDRVVDSDQYESDDSNDECESRRRASASLENLVDRNRPMSPDCVGRQNADNFEHHNGGFKYSDEDEEVAQFNQRVRMINENSALPTKGFPNRSKSPEVNRSVDKSEKIISRKSRKDLSKSADGAPVTRQVMSQPVNRSLSPIQQVRQANGVARCVSPDPMQDEEFQRMRKETSMNAKQGKKDRKISFKRKKSEENVMAKTKMQEAFVKSSKEQDKRKDGTWLSKPTSILKSITSNDTAVSVFKAKTNEEETFLDAIEEEEISTGQAVLPKTRQIQVKEVQAKPEVWDIIDEQYYRQVNRKATNKLKKTISSESRSSLWSFISTPDDIDDDDLDDILECLPGMTDPADLRTSEIKVSDILAEREKAVQKEEAKKRFSLSDFNKSKFELIDYYDMLKSKQITLHDVPEDKREMLLNVVEIKREEKLRKEGKIVPQTVLRSDEMYDDNMSPGASDVNRTMSPSGKKLVGFRQGQSNASSQHAPTKSEKDPRLDRARSAPLKRPRTPMHKPMTEKPPEINPAFNDTRTITVAKRNKARAALKRALSNKNAPSYQRNERDRERTQQSTDMSLKYATIRKVNANGENTGECEQEEILTVPVPTSESFSLTTSKPTQNTKDIKRYSSFSSNESASSIGSSVRQRRADVSLTSGEVSSLSSQAESDHYETDGHLTDAEAMTKPYVTRKQSLVGRTSRVDSGFDSGSMSSEMSDAFMNRAKQFNQNLTSKGGPNKSKGVVNSWARNYKMVDSVSNSPYNFSNKFLPPNDGQFESGPPVGKNESRDDFDKCSQDSGYSQTSKTVSKDYTSDKTTHGKSKLKPGQEIKSLHMSPYGDMSSRPLSPLSRPMSPQNRSISPANRPMPPNDRTMSPNGRAMSPISDRPMSPNSHSMSPKDRPMSPNGRHMSPNIRPMSPNVQPTEKRPFKHASRPMSPAARLLSPRGPRQSKKVNQTFAPGRKLAKPPSPTMQIRAKSVDRATAGTPVKTESGAHEERNPRVRSLSPPMSIKSETSTNSDSTAKASKRYRELVKQGVPLRTSVIDSSPTRQTAQVIETCEHMESRPNTADSVVGRPVDDQELFESLEAKGFFVTRQRSRSPYKGSSPNRTKTSNTSSDNRTTNKRKQKQKRKQIPLEELVREKPAVKGTPAKAHRSPSNNHLTVSEEAYLNQPTSEDSETCSIKTNKSNVSTPSGSKPKVMVDAEMVIDRIFSQNHPTDHELDVEVEAALGLDKDPFKAVNELYLNGRSPDPTDLNTIPLLNGMTDKHIHNCMELASGLHVITVRDLLPASNKSFDILRTKLQQVGQLGNVGNQLLDIIQRCWLLDLPPSSGELVEQLTDPVTETEL